MGIAKATKALKDRKEFYENWDEGPNFNVSRQEGRFDLDDTQTSFLADQGLTEAEADAIETQFIDELYGTSEGRTLDESGADLGLSQGEWQATYFDDSAAIASNTANSVWGLDLRRTMLDEDGGEITSSHPEYFEHLTRGDVDWAANDTFSEDIWKNIGEDRDKLYSSDYTDAEKASWIRKANFEQANPYLENKLKGKSWLSTEEKGEHNQWEDKYNKDEIFRDKQGGLWMQNEEGVAERQPTLSDLWNSGDPLAGMLKVNQPGKATAILERREVGRPNIPGVSWSGDKPSLTNPTKVKVPWNVKGLVKGGKT